MSDVFSLMQRAEQLLDRLEQWIPLSAGEPDWAAPAFRWRKQARHGYLQPVYQPHRISLEDLHNIGPQKAEIERNTRQFAEGRLANNVLLTGARGTGKSSLVKAAWLAFAAQGLKLIEVDKQDLTDLPDIVDLVSQRQERFILFCDDLSFEEGESSYKALKTVLDGSIAAPSANVLIYATSNRRHLLPEYYHENAATRYVGEEIHPNEAVEEKIALSERFGLWLSFYPFDQNQYLAAARHWLSCFGLHDWNEAIEREALQWAQTRGARSGRVAWQFARDYAGQHA